MIQFSNSGYIIQLHIKWNVFRFEHHQFYFCRTFHTEEVIIAYLAQKTSGLPPEALLDCKSETFGGGTIQIPMVETYVRCLEASYKAMPTHTERFRHLT